MEKQGNLLKKFIYDDPLKLATTIFTVVALLLAAYLTNRLAPLVQDIGLLGIRVSAVEKVQEERADQYSQIPLIDRDINNIKENLAELKVDNGKQHTQIMDKLDQIIWDR